jgi:sortase A
MKRTPGRDDGGMAVTSRPSRTPPGRTRRGPVFHVGLLLLLAGLGVMVYVGWQMFGTTVVSHHRADQITERTERAWKKGYDGPAAGILHVPRFGKGYAVPIIRGFDEDTLAKGVAWYPKGAAVGQVGNYVLAGHRITHGQPFSKFPDLRKGDLVSVETRTATYTYRLRNAGQSITVDFHQSWPLWPVPSPDAKGRPATRPVLTMLTCSELFHTDNRNVVIGDLVKTVPR